MFKLNLLLAVCLMSGAAFAEELTIVSALQIVKTAEGKKTYVVFADNKGVGEVFCSNKGWLGTRGSYLTIQMSPGRIFSKDTIHSFGREMGSNVDCANFKDVELLDVSADNQINLNVDKDAFDFVD